MSVLLVFQLLLPFQQVLASEEIPIPDNVGITEFYPGDIRIDWDNATGISSYRIYQIGEEIKQVAQVTTNRAVLRGLNEGSYTFAVTSVKDDKESNLSQAVGIDIEYPEMQAPNNVNSTIRNGNDILLRWDESEYASEYKVYQVINGKRELISTRTTTSLNVTNLQEGQYTYEITSYNERFGESQESSQVEVDLVHPEMQAPENVKPTIRNGNDILLRWDESEFATTYKVYQVKDGKKELISTRTTTSLNLVNLPEDGYIYEITSYSDRFGESQESSRVEVDLLHPEMQAPGNFKELIRNGNDILLRWDETEFAAEYKVYQVKDGQKKLISTRSTTSLNLANLPEDDYIYEITSYSDRFGESEKSSRVEVELTHPEIQAPNNFREFIRNGNDILLRWDESEYATEYRVYREKDGQKELISTRTTTSLILPNLPEGNYNYEITSFSDRFGESEKTSRLGIDLIHPEMQAPENFKPTIRNGNDILLRWDEFEFATEYNVFQVIDDERIFLSAVSGTSLNITNLQEGNYIYEVTSYSDRFGESETTVRTEETIIFPEVEAPVIQLKITGENSARITWKSITNIGLYNVYTLVDGEAQLIGSSNRTTFDVKDLADGKHEFVVRAVHERFGESADSNIVSMEIQSDKNPPETTSNISGDWLNESFTVELTAVDDKSGVASTHYSVNGSEYKEGTIFTVTEEGVNEISYYSVDIAGNVEEVKTEHVKVDKTAPETTSNITDDWFKEDVVVELTATDSTSGVAATYYSVNGQEYEEGTTFTVTEEGINEVSYYSVDKAGNVEEVKTEHVKVDKTAPETTSNITGDWFKEDVVVELTAIDNTSGVAATYYSINGTEYEEGTTFAVKEEGINEVSYYSVDKAGNVEEVRTETVKVDKTVPETTSNITDEWFKEEVVLELTATDSTSRVAATYYSINGTEYEEGTTFTVMEEGINEVSYYSVDNAGNVEEATVESVKIDKTTPTVSLDIKDEYALGTELQLVYEAKDNLSGIATETLTVNEEMITNGDVVSLEQPGHYKVKVDVEDQAGWVTTVEKEFVVYIPAKLDVLPGIIADNKGVFTVKVNLPDRFHSSQFDLDSVTLNGNAAISKNNGHKNQAKRGQFQFNREDFQWNESEKHLEFRGMLGDQLVVGYATVKVQLKNNKK
jgi:fibronectin type 3 domain-containing protein/stress response protein YsnF